LASSDGLGTRTRTTLAARERIVKPSTEKNTSLKAGVKVIGVIGGKDGGGDGFAMD